MLEEQVEQLHNNQNPHAQMEDQIVDWQPGQLIATTPITEEEVAEVAVEESTELKLADMERYTIQKALAKNNGNRKATAVELGLSERTLYRKIKDYGL